MERQQTEDGRKTIRIYQERKVSFCNITDECKTSTNDFDRKDVLVWIFSFMADGDDDGIVYRTMDMYIR